MPLETGIVSATGQKGVIQQNDLLNYLNNQYGNVSTRQNFAKIFPDLVNKKVNEEKFNEIYGTGISGASKEILSKSDALWARELLKTAGISTFSDTFKAKLNSRVKNVLYNGTIEQLMDNQLKNKEGDDKTLPVFDGMKIVSTPNGSYIEIDGVQQPLDSRVLTNSYEGRQLLTAQQSLSQKVREENWQRIITKENPNSIYQKEKQIFDSKIPIKINDKNTNWSSEVIYQIHTDREFNQQVVPLLVIKDENGVPLINQELSDYTDLFTAKQLVEAYKNNGVLSQINRQIIQQKADEIEKENQ